MEITRNAKYIEKFDFILNQSAAVKVAQQRNAKKLLFEGFQLNPDRQNVQYSKLDQLTEKLSESTNLFLPNAVQKEIYCADTGTHIVPEIFKKILTNIKLSFIIQPGSIKDLTVFVEWANEHKANYTVRGAGTWPFGGVVPLDGDIVLDLSLIDFMDFDAEEKTMLLGAGVVFPNARKFLKQYGFTLKQEISNNGSGTICGWIATGGLGIGSYKYGHIRESVQMLLVVKPDGELLILTPEDDEFDNYFGSEGQFGIIAAARIKLRKESFVTKPYAFSFQTKEDAHQFMKAVNESDLKPTSVIFFSASYIREVVDVATQQIEKKISKALMNNDQFRLGEAQEDRDLIQEMSTVEQIVVLHFDELIDYQLALKSRLFGASREKIRLNHITYFQVSTALAHLFWEHRFLPVQIKQKGPSLIVSETMLPLRACPRFDKYLQDLIAKLLNVEILTESHLMPGGHVLVQSIFLADTRTFRHKLYFATIPLMAQVAYNFGARPYGIGIWNYPSMKQWRDLSNGNAKQLSSFKKGLDPNGIINHGKFLNPKGQHYSFRVFKRLTPIFTTWFIKTYNKRLQGKKLVPSYLVEKMIWRAAKLLFPHVIPPDLKINSREPIEQLISVCAECDSCERVCPTSDVFGLYGPATPITRRKTAARLIQDKQIDRLEALGFLTCTRCDNCTDVCPTNIPLTELFDKVEENEKFNNVLKLEKADKQEFIDRFWQIMKESPLYLNHTLAEQKDDKSHLAHGLRIIYSKGFSYSHLFIDPETCIHCGMCSSENACIYGARESQPRKIPELLDINCALCNACVNFCPQNKIAQHERQFIDKLVKNAVDLEEKKYWAKKQNRIHDTTKVIRSEQVTEMSDLYVTEEIIMEIDKEAATGRIPVSGAGQGDRHMGIGFDAERFAHFHIVGPAQNRLHEGDPDEELSVILGKREDFCKFDRSGNLVNPLHPNIKLMTPILYNSIPLESNGKVELVLIKVAQQQKSLVVITLERLLEHYHYILEQGQYENLPEVIIARVDYDLINRLIVNPKVNRDILSDLWRMPIFEVEYHPKIEQTINFIKDSVDAVGKKQPLISGYLEISEYDLIGSLTLTADTKEKVNMFLDLGVDILHLKGLRNKEKYFVTSKAVRALHHYLMRIGKRHEVSIVASGGIRLASDTQKTIQRGAEATLIDFSALLALDPTAYWAIIENKITTEKLLSLDLDWAIKRLNNQAESRKVQILEVLGAAGFKDIKKTVGEEGRLIDFYRLENRIQHNIFDNPALIQKYDNINQELINSEPIPEQKHRTYNDLKKQIVPVSSPHNFYRLGDTNQKLYKRDFVWPGHLLRTLGKMAAGDLSMLDLRNVEGTGLLGDGFDVMKILYNKDPMDVPDSELNNVKTALPLDKDLILEAPWMFGGKSVGSIGLDTWKAHVFAAQKLGIQFDTGEGGYPTCFFLNSKGEPIFFKEKEIQQIKPFFINGKTYTISEFKEILNKNGITQKSFPGIFDKVGQFPTLKPFQFVIVVDNTEQPFVSTELKTGLFGVSKESIKKARRVVIAYSQGAKMGIGGHILSQKVNKLVSYMRGVEGIEKLNIEKIEKLYNILKKLSETKDHPLQNVAASNLNTLDHADQIKSVSEALKEALWKIQERAYQLNHNGQIDPIEFKNLIRLCEEVIEFSYISIISPFPFHNCYSIEDVKAFIDVIRMINPQAVVSIKVSPSIDIEFIATGLARIAKDNTEEMLKSKLTQWKNEQQNLSFEMAEYAKKYGMKIEIWLDGPRGGTGASPNIIKGQMGMHLEYAIPMIHYRLVQDSLRNYVKFIVSGGIRTYEDVIKAIALGADGIVWGTAPLVAIGCDRNRNCHDGCSRGIATSNLALQKLRDVEVNTQQIINAFTMMQMQVIRALAALGFSDIRQLRGRFDQIHWIGLKERVDHRYRIRKEVIKEIEKDEKLFGDRLARRSGQSNCGVAAINGSMPIPGHILDLTLQSMRNRGMDGVGIAKTLCFPDHANEYAFRVMVKGMLQKTVESSMEAAPDLKFKSREKILKHRIALMKIIKSIFLDPYFNFISNADPKQNRESYKLNDQNQECDYRQFGNDNTDPGDIFRFFIRVKKPVLYKYIENDLLRHGRPRFLEHLFPDINLQNYKSHAVFLNKAEDLFVLNHSHDLTRILYVSSVKPEELEIFAGKKLKIKRWNEEFLLHDADSKNQREYLTLLRDFMQSHAYEHHKHRYGSREHKIAAVMSCGKNFAIWKTAGREIPWQTPDAPNNIIHVRLATGSVVEQMNAHPFAKLHTALTHNGETTNYEALKQRVEQFNLSPLASTDTEVASLKFHLTADEWEYPDWALFESFSPTTGDDLELLEPEIRQHLEQVQRVEFASSPDGPYQYLCLRHNPYKKITERVDLKDPADLRPNVSAFWFDEKKNQKRFFSIIASEEHAIHTMLGLLDQHQVIDGAAPDQIFVNNGMISRYYFNNKNQIENFELIDRYGKKINLANPGEHYSVRRTEEKVPDNINRFQNWDADFRKFFTEQLKDLNFENFRYLLSSLIAGAGSNDGFEKCLEIYSWLRDYIRTISPGQKSQGSLIDIIQFYIEKLLDKTKNQAYKNYVWCDQKQAARFFTKPKGKQKIVIDATDFLPEGTDPDFVLTSFLAKAYDLGWREFILYGTRGQRLISTAAMGPGDTDDVEMDVYGSVGEYFAAFMQGGIIRLHGNAQNFCAMCMHHGELYVFGHAGKVCGYASKGGKVYILGNVVDRAWTNSVNDMRGQPLEIFILGSATKYAGESLMGGNFFFAGLHFDNKGNLQFNDRPYFGTKMLGGASRGNFLFFDPRQRLIQAQYTHGHVKKISQEEWKPLLEKIENFLKFANVKIFENNGTKKIQVEDETFELIPENFKMILPKGGLKGYELH